jgi:hypothetical protein
MGNGLTLKYIDFVKCIPKWFIKRCRKQCFEKKNCFQYNQSFYFYYVSLISLKNERTQNKDKE